MPAKRQYARGNLLNPKYLFIGEAWGSEEEQAQKPFVGPAGRLLGKLISTCGISERDCAFTNLVDARPPGNDFKQFLVKTQNTKALGMEPFQGLFVRPDVKKRLGELWAFIDQLNPEYIIPLGNYPLWFFAGARSGIANVSGYKVPTGITKWRGSQLIATSLSGRHYRVMPTYHPAAILRQWELHRDFIHDLRFRLQCSWKEPEYNFIINPSLSDALEVLHSVLDKKDIAVDLEITKQKTIACIGIGWSDRDAICIPVSKYSKHERLELALYLHEFFKNKRVIGQNFLFDAQYLFHYYLLYLPPFYDTMLMQHLLSPGTPLDLNYLSSLYCRFHRYWKDEGKEMHTKEGEIQGWIYNCKDVVSTFEVAKRERVTLKMEDMEDLYSFQRRQADMILRMMLRGVKVNLNEREFQKERLMAEIKKLEAELKNYLPSHMVKTDRWFNSPKQLMEVFYERLNIRPVRTHTGAATVNEEALEKIAAREPLVRHLIYLLRHYRKLKKFLDFVKMGIDEDGRMRCEFSPTAETFRWKSRKNVFGLGGNLQNLPKGGEFD